MNGLTIILAYIGLLLAGLLGITLSVPLQAPAVILFGCAAIVAGLGLLGRRNVAMGGKQAEGRANMWLLGLVMVATVYFVGRACYSPVWDLGVEDLMLILPAAILYLVAGHALCGEQAVRLRMALAWTVLLVLVLHLVSAAMQVFGGDGFSLTPLLTGAGRSSGSQISGMYGYYGSFANFAVMSGLLCLALGVWGRSRIGLRVLLVMLGFVAFGLAVYSQSRSALVSLVPALAVFVVLYFVSLSRQAVAVQKRAKHMVGGAVAVLLLAGGVAAVWVFQSRAQSQDGLGLESLMDAGVRMPFWAMAAEQWVDHPLIGAGSRSFSYLCFEYWSPNMGTNEHNPEFVHNEYLQLLADYGLVGLFLVGALLVWHVASGGRMLYRLSRKLGEGGLRRGSNAVALTIAGVSGMTAMAVHVCFDFRTHLLANLLLLVCCAAWVLPLARFRPMSPGGSEARNVDDHEGVAVSRNCDGRARGLAIVLLVLGMGAVGMGGQQLWAGLPLMQNRIAKEDGSWRPDLVDREVWIPVLEESLSRYPQWRRYLRLGTLYQLEAAQLGTEEGRRYSLDQAKLAYQACIERHPYNPIPRTNLAAVYTQTKQWSEADAMYASAAEMAKAREWWFRTPVKWAETHRLWARTHWENNNKELAGKHYRRALEIISNVQVNNGDATTMYLKIVVDYSRMLDSEEAYEQTDRLFEQVEARLPLHAINSLNQNIRREMGEHYLRKAKFLWYARKSEEAYQALKKAKRSFQIHRVVLKGKDDERWKAGSDETNQILKFFQTTGIAPVKE